MAVKKFDQHLPKQPTHNPKFRVLGLGFRVYGFRWPNIQTPQFVHGPEGTSRSKCISTKSFIHKPVLWGQQQTLLVPLHPDHLHRHVLPCPIPTLPHELPISQVFSKARISTCQKAQIIVSEGYPLNSSEIIVNLHSTSQDLCRKLDIAKAKVYRIPT
jgi:hypothetical protein